MDYTEIYLYAFVSYLTGSFPSAVWFGKLFCRIDVRKFGSGNAGATNTFRVLGKRIGALVLFFDILKGWISVNYVTLISQGINNDFISTSLYFELQLMFGFFAVIGHLFPLFARFKGGKGVATILGLLLAIQPIVALLSLVIFIIVFFIFRYVSLASIIASISFTIFIYIFSQVDNRSLEIFAIFVPLLTLITHSKNIKRLVQGEETKVKFEKK